MKFKRTISLLLTFLIVTTVFTAVPFSVSAAENAETAMVGASSGTTGDCTWTLDDNGTLTISGNGKMGDYSVSGGDNIKRVIIEKGVTSIGKRAFAHCERLTSITIPNSVTSIGDYAFDDCTSLTSITIPDRVTRIGDHVFENCESLTSITIPDSVTSIDYDAFYGCTSLASITVNPNNKKYDSRNNCNAIIETDTNTLIVGCSTTVIPDSVTSIGAGAFDGCTSLTSITIPDSVTSIGDWAFRECTSLTSITIPNSVTSIGDYAFDDCTSLTSITIPDRVTRIGDHVFENCESLTSITIPDRVTRIGGYAFSGCTSLTSITIPDSVTSIDYDAFSGCTSLTSITIGNGVTSIGYAAFSECTSLTSITIPDSVTSIDDRVFDGCTSLTSITIPDSVTFIGYGAFAYCTSLASISVNQNNETYDSRNNCNAIIETDTNTLIVGCRTTVIPDSVTSIGNYAFYKCTSLTSITIPDSVTSIGAWAFYGCTSLTSITIPDSVTSIYYSAFAYCTSLTSITIPNSVTSIGNATFYGCTSLTSISVNPNNKTYDSRNNCNAIIETDTNTLIVGCRTTVILDSVTSIGEDAFGKCTSLTSITIPDSVTSIGNEAFYGCTSLTSATVGNGVTSIGDYAFDACTSLTSITIPDSVTSIGQGAFDNCTSLASVIIGNSVTYIGTSAFENCRLLSDIYYGGNEAQWSRITIDYRNQCLHAAAIHFNSFTGYTNALTPVNTNSGSSSQAGSSSQTNSVSVKTSNNSTLNIELEKDLEFTVPSNVPLIGGKAMKLDLSFVPLTAAVTENSIKIGIGYNRDLTADTDEQTWCNWKNYVKGYKDAVSKGTELFGDVVNKKKGIASAGMGKDLDFEFYGYFEGTIQNGQVIGSGVAKIKLEGALKNEWQTAIGFVPIVVKLKGRIGVENTSSLSLNFSTKELSFTNQLDITLPQITASAGVGIAHVADVSVYGEAKNVFSIYSKPKKITGTLFGELGVSAKALFWSAKLPILSIGNGSGWTYYDSTKNLFLLRWECLIMMI